MMKGIARAARSLEIENLDRKGQATEAEMQELDMYLSVWAKIKDIRVYSNELESAVQQDITTDIHSGWPE
jgi:hypothetical protein